MKTLLLTMILAISFNSFANEAAVARFDEWFNILEIAMKSSSSSKIADNLVKGPSRVAAFNLQALGKVYQSQDKKFKNLRSDFKSLEDKIGTYKKWNDILKVAIKRNSKKSKIEKLKSQKLEAKEDLKILLKKRSWINADRLTKYKKHIANYDFGSYKQDKGFVTKNLAKSLKKLDESDFDMFILEEGNGVHELRREIRWFVIKARVLGGLIQFKATNRCPISYYKNLPAEKIAESKYSSLPKGELETKPCLISQCLFLALVQKVNQLGKLKDSIEEDLNLQDVLTDETPQKYIDDLNKLYNEFLRYSAVAELSQELKACY